MSLRLKLLLWYTGVLAVSGALLAGTMYGLVAHRMRSEVNNDLEEEVAEWRAMTLDSLGDLPALTKQIRTEVDAEGHFPMSYRLHDRAAGRDLLFLTNEDIAHLREPLRSVAPLDVGPEVVWSHTHLGEEQRPLHVVTVALDPVQHPGLVIQVAQEIRRLERREASMRRYLFITFCGTVVLAAIGGWFLAGRSLKPIEDTVAELSRIESRSLGERLAVGQAGDELDRLRAAINGMLGRIEDAFSKLQSFTADAAHELRTPLAALRCRLEVALNKARTEADCHAALSDALEQAAELSTLTDNLLLLARMDANDALPGAQPVAIETLCSDLCEPFAILAEHNGVELAATCQPGLTVHGDPVLLRRLVGNLLDNAIRYTPEGGRVTVAAERDADGCRVTVADTGVGIEPEALGHIFDRFYRTDESRSREAGGAGLGLSIARRVAEIHRGRIDLDSTPGKGTTATVWLPTTDPRAA